MKHRRLIRYPLNLICLTNSHSFRAPNLIYLPIMSPTTLPTLSGLPQLLAILNLSYPSSSLSYNPPKLICPTNSNYYHPPKISCLAFFNSYTSDLAYSAHTSDIVCLSTPTSATLSKLSALPILPLLPFS